MLLDFMESISLAQTELKTSMKCFKVFPFNILHRVWCLAVGLMGLTHCVPNRDGEEDLQAFYKVVFDLKDQDSLHALLGTTLSAAQEAMVWNQLAWELGGDYATLDSALTCGRRARRLAAQANYPQVLADAHNRVGRAFSKLGNPDSALASYRRSMAIEIAQGNEYGIARSHNQVGEALASQGKYAEAIRHYQAAVPIFEGLDEYGSAHSALNNLAEAGRHIGEDSLVWAALQQAVLLYKEYHTKPVLGGESYLELGRYYIKQRKYSEAKEYLEWAQLLNHARVFQARIALERGLIAQMEGNLLVAMQHYQQVRNWQSPTSITYQEAVYNLALVYDALGELDSAGALLQSAMHWLEQNVDSLQLGRVYSELGTLAYKQQQYDSAEYYYQKSLQWMNALSSTEAVHPIFNLTLLYEQTNQDSLALYYRKLYEKDYQQALDAQREAEKARLRAENALARSEAERLHQARQNGLMRTIGVLLLLLLLGLVSAWAYRRRAWLAKREAEVLRQETEVSQVRAKLQGEEQTKKRIARDIHDELGNILTLIRVHFEAIEKSMTTQHQVHTHHYQEAFSLLGKAVDFSRNIAEELDPVTLRSFGLIPALKDIQNSLHGVNGLQVQLIPIRMTERLPNWVERMVFQLIQEIVGNVVKHAHATSLTIQLVRHADTLNISVEDNGIGFDPEAVSQREGRRGRGLPNLRSRVDALGGTLTIDSRPHMDDPTKGSGTSVMIDISLTQLKDTHD